METDATDKIEKLKDFSVPKVIIDPTMETDREKIFFPEKLEKANEMLKTAKLPELKQGSRPND